MKYLKVTNIPLLDLLHDGINTSKVNWSLFGFEVSVVRRLAVQGNTDADTMVTCIPITNDTTMNEKLAILQQRVEATPIATDSVEIITEEEMTIVKTAIETYRASQQVV